MTKAEQERQEQLEQELADTRAALQRERAARVDETRRKAFAFDLLTDLYSQMQDSPGRTRP